MRENEDHYIVPATPGWSVAVYVSAGKDYDEYLFLETIIAWEIQREEGLCDPRAGGRPGQRYLHHDVVPITVEGNMNRKANPWAIKSPDGIYVVPEVGFFKTDADALEELREQWKEFEKSRVRPRAEA